MSRVARRADGWLPAGLPVPYLMDMWYTILEEAQDAGRDPSTLCMVLRVNPVITERKADRVGVPASGTLGQYIDYARTAAEAGVHELFVDFG